MKNYAIISIISLLLAGCGEYRSVPSVQLNNADPQAIADYEIQAAPPACNSTMFNDFKVVIAKNCASCHQPGSPMGDYRDYTTAFAKKDLIRVRVLEKKDMPMGKKLSAAELDVIAKWIDAGSPALCVESSSQLSEQGLRILEESSAQMEPMAEPMAQALPDNVKSVFSRNCAACHNGQMAIGIMNYQAAYNLKDRIQARVLEKKDMPMGGKLNSADFKVIQDWIAAGAPPKG